MFHKLIPMIAAIAASPVSAQQVDHKPIADTDLLISEQPVLKPYGQRLCSNGQINPKTSLTLTSDQTVFVEAVGTIDAFNSGSWIVVDAIHNGSICGTSGVRTGAGIQSARAECGAIKLKSGVHVFEANVRHHYANARTASICVSLK